MPKSSKPLGCNQYPWDTFYRRDNHSFMQNLDRSLSEVAASGADSIEPNLESIEDLAKFAALMPKHSLQMRSLYVNSVLHEQDLADTSIEKAFRISIEAQRLCQTQIVVTNPSPISWGGPENKTNSQIVTQAKALNKLGAMLRKEGLTLAYHNHDSELRMGARELLHCLVSTDPDNVKYCLDSHWIYRGSGDSTIALFDMVELFGNRIVELHVRQSRDGIWSEAYSTEGDIDYPRLIKTLKAKGIDPLIVSEQAIETESPNTLTALEAHKQTHKAIRNDFADFL